MDRADTVRREFSGDSAQGSPPEARSKALRVVDPHDRRGALQAEVDVSHRVILPPPERAATPLPGWLAAVALVGIAALLCVALPAMVRQRGLAADHARLRCRTECQEREVRRLERELRAARSDTFARERALRRLLLPPPVAPSPLRDARPAPVR